MPAARTGSARVKIPGPLMCTPSNRDARPAKMPSSGAVSGAAALNICQYHPLSNTHGSHNAIRRQLVAVVT